MAKCIDIPSQEYNTFRLQIRYDPGSRLHLIVCFTDELDTDILIVLSHLDLDFFQYRLEKYVFTAAYDDGNFRRNTLLQFSGNGIRLIASLAYDLADLFSCFFTDIRPVVDYSRYRTDTVAGYPRNVYRTDTVAGYPRNVFDCRHAFTLSVLPAYLSQPSVNVTVNVSKNNYSIP